MTTRIADGLEPRRFRRRIAHSRNAPVGARRFNGVFGVPLLVILVLAGITGLLAGFNPMIGMVFALGLGFFLLVLANLTLGVCVFVVASFMDVIPALSGAFGVTKGIGLLLMASWIAAIGMKQRPNFFSDRPYLTYAIFAFLGWVAVASSWSEDTGTALGELLRFALNAVLFPIVYAATRKQSDIRWIVFAIVLGAAFSAAWGMTHPAVPGTAESTDGERLSGGGSLDPNELAAVLVVGMVFAVAAAASSKDNPGVRTFASAAAALCLIGLWLTQSRGGLIALFVAVLVAPVAAGRRWRTKAAAFSMSLMIVIAVYFTAFAPTAAVDRLTQLGSGTGRTDLWTVAGRMFEHSPIVGIGTGDFEAEAPNYVLRPGTLQRSDLILGAPRSSHNLYLQMLAQLGIVGLLLLLALICTSFVSGAKAVGEFKNRGDPIGEALARAYVVALIALLAADTFLSAEFSKQLWLMLALGPSLLAVARRMSSPASEDKRATATHLDTARTRPNTPRTA